MDGFIDALLLIASFVVMLGILRRSNRAARPGDELPLRTNRRASRPDLDG